MADDKANLDDFLKKIDDIGGIVRGLARGNDAEAKAAMCKADSMLDELDVKNKTVKKKYPPTDNTGENRTVINHKAFKDEAPPQNLDQAAFMAAMQKDADERHERKKKAQEEAMVFKDKGNAEFKAGNYDQAIEFYTQGLEKIRDMIALYTNRAQAYIKIGKYEEALSDCDWALRVSDKCIKAYIHQGRAHLGMQQYDKAIDSYKQAALIDPAKENMVKTYIAEVELARETANQETDARQVFEKGETHAKGVVDILDKINKAEQLPLYYSGGFRILIDLLKTNNERTLFRSHGGLQLIRDHPTLSRCLSVMPRDLSREEIDVCTSAVDLFSAACTDNAENARQLLDMAEFHDCVQKFAGATLRKGVALRAATVNLMHVLTLNDLIRSKVIATFNIPRLLSSLFQLQNTSDSTTTNAIAVLNNLSLDQKFKSEMRGGVETILPSFENLLEEGTSNQSMLQYCISMVINLCGDTYIRAKLTKRTSLFAACCGCVESHLQKVNEKTSQDVLHACLGLLMNLTFDPSACLEEFAVRICKSCKELLNQSDSADLRARNVALLGHILPKAKEATKYAVSNEMVTKFVDLTETDDDAVKKNAVKCLTACTQDRPEAREQLIAHQHGLKCVVGLLKHADEGILGNTALCLAHCTQVDDVCKRLSKTSIIMHLLVLARDGRPPALQQNAAILIAKLAQGHPSHLERLRELDGIGILHNCMKYIK